MYWSAVLQYSLSMILPGNVTVLAVCRYHKILIEHRNFSTSLTKENKKAERDYVPHTQIPAFQSILHLWHPDSHGKEDNGREYICALYRMKRGTRLQPASTQPSSQAGPCCVTFHFLKGAVLLFEPWEHHTNLFPHKHFTLEINKIKINSISSNKSWGFFQGFKKRPDLEARNQECQAQPVAHKQLEGVLGSSRVSLILFRIGTV